MRSSIALSRALTEAAQTRLTYIAGIRDDLSPAEYQEAPDAEIGDAAATEAAFAKAAHVTRFETWVQRVTGVPMEPRGALAAFDSATGRLML